MTETPLYLKVWTRHCICYQYRKLIFKGKIFSINPKHDNIRLPLKTLIQCYGWPLCFSWKLIPNCQSLLRWNFRFLWGPSIAIVSAPRLLAKNFWLAKLSTNMRYVLNVGLEGLRNLFYLLLFLPHGGMYIHYILLFRLSSLYKSLLKSSKT